MLCAIKILFYSVAIYLERFLNLLISHLCTKYDVSWTFSSLFSIGMLILTVVPHHFQCSLEMHLILMARYGGQNPITVNREGSVCYWKRNFVSHFCQIIQYAIFGKVTKGDETLRKLEQLPTRREGIFVMVSFLLQLFSFHLKQV